MPRGREPLRHRDEAENDRSNHSYNQGHDDKPSYDVQRSIPYDDERVDDSDEEKRYRYQAKVRILPSNRSNPQKARPS